MKKKIILGLLVIIGLFTVTGCTGLADLFKGKRTINYLLDGYVTAYTKADLKAAKDIFPNFYLKYNEKNVNQESLNKELESAKKTYGDDFNIIYEVQKETKFTDEELKTYNEKIKKNYNAEEEASECYKYEGTITLKGSNKTDNLSLTSIARCNFNGTWYLVRK